MFDLNQESETFLNQVGLTNQNGCFITENDMVISVKTEPNQIYQIDVLVENQRGTSQLICQTTTGENLLPQSYTISSLPSYYLLMFQAKDKISQIGFKTDQVSKIKITNLKVSKILLDKATSTRNQISARDQTSARDQISTRDQISVRDQSSSDDFDIFFSDQIDQLQASVTHEIDNVSSMSNQDLLNWSEKKLFDCGVLDMVNHLRQKQQNHLLDW